ncbi:hypothetical protein DN069_36415 [Streptacidiphilus pinicola]|uniref:Transcription regulator HTH AraC- type ligand binding domain-containing protein n=1 Tax=Streptacidiphilus pinicola TaxID=2219663 RepID=A0A2X0I862_9ACTN|nr:hypothetical protein DN069_36415 [Streptacidiphilus pinicola]
MWQGASASAVPAADRFDWFDQVVANALAPVALRPLDAAAFHAEGAVLDLGEAQISRFSYSPVGSRRTSGLIRKRDPEQYQLGLGVPRSRTVDLPTDGRWKPPVDS